MSVLLNNRYRILQVLGSGGCGQTFLAEDTHMPSSRRCVVKQLKPTTKDPLAYQIIQERFQREAALLETLGRANDQIPALYAYFTEDKEFYLVQDWIEGKSLMQKLGEEGPLDEGAVRRLLLSLLPVLQYVHSQGIIHRDIKPDNIMMRAADNQPVLIDFGAVKEVVATVVDSLGTPTSSIVIGSPGFMPLEQASGRPVFASDLFSLGLTAICLLTGKLPRELSDRSSGEIVWRHLAPNVGSKLAMVLDKATEPLARDRYQTAQAMLDALKPGGTPTLAAPGQRLQHDNRHKLPSSPTLLPTQPHNQIEVPSPKLSEPTSKARATLAVIASYIAMFVLTFIAFTGVYLSLGTDIAFKPGTYDASNLWLAISVCVNFVIAIIGGLICAAIARGGRAPVALAVVVFVLGLLLAIPSIMAQKARLDMVRTGNVSNMEAMQRTRQPIWVPILFPFIGAAGVLIGGRLKRRG
jgi:serine/threonine protein kinase